MVPNCMSSMTRKASGTWSSDRDSVMSAAAEYFYRDKDQPDCVILYITCILSMYILGLMTGRAHPYPKSPVSIYSDDKVDHIDEKHEGVNVTHRTVVWVDDVIEKLPYG